ncbi:MAG: AraC family transcriptional regulator [Paracoccaceae bacterium]
MTFHPAMRSELRGIHARRPLRFRAWPGVVADFWEASGTSGGGGHYLSPQPRIVLFLDDGAAGLELSGAGVSGQGVAALYVPADVPIASRITATCDFAHVDLHLQTDALERRLASVDLRRDPRRPQLLADTDRLRPLAQMIAAEIACPTRAAIMMEGLLLATLAEVFEAPPEVGAAPARAQSGGLTPFQMAALGRHVDERIDRHLPVAELALAVGLSESWFAHAFKLTTGQSPQRWQMQRRLAAAQSLMLADPLRPLAEVAFATGFADQAHFTRSFRAEKGVPPATWRRRQAMGPNFAAEPFK